MLFENICNASGRHITTPLYGKQTPMLPEVKGLKNLVKQYEFPNGT